VQDNSDTAVAGRLPAQLVAELRLEFPITREWVYLDHATYGPHPRRYVEALSRVARDLSEEVLGTTSMRVEDVRASASRLLHAPTEQVALLRSTGEAMSLVATGVDWHADDEVILYELDFPSLIAPWLASGVKVQVVRDRGRGCFDVADFVDLMSPRTRAVAVSLVNNTTGFRAPLEQLGRICAERGIWFSVDAVQAIGSVDVDVPSLNADVVAAHSYKFLLSGFGQGVAYFSERAIRELKVPHVGLRNIQPSPGGSLFDTGVHLYESAQKFEPSAPNLAATLAMGACLELLLDVGPERVAAHNLALCRRLADGVIGKGYSLVCPEHAGLVCVRKDGLDMASVQQKLAAEHIMCAVRGGNLRFAPHLYNTLEEVEQVLQALP